MPELDNPKLVRLVELAEVLSRINDFQEILRVVAKKALGLIPAEIALILMVNPQTRHTFKTLMREGQEGDSRKYQSVQTQISGWIMQNAQPLLSADVKIDPRFRRVNWGNLAIQSVIGVPLRTENVIIGTLILLNPSGVGEDDLAYLEKIGVIATPLFAQRAKNCGILQRAGA